MCDGDIPVRRLFKIHYIESLFRTRQRTCADLCARIASGLAAKNAINSRRDLTRGS